MKRALISLAILPVILLASAPFPGFAPAEAKGQDGSRSLWSVRLDRPGLPNLHRVSSVLFRGAQPDERGFAELKKIGIKTIVNLRRSDRDRKSAGRHGLEYVHIPMSASAPERDKLELFLKIAADPSKQPVFVHCLHGADRTGAAVALYRIRIQGWDREEAIREMVSGGHGFHEIYSGLKDFIRGF